MGPPVHQLGGRWPSPTISVDWKDWAPCPGFPTAGTLAPVILVLVALLHRPDQTQSFCTLSLTSDARWVSSHPYSGRIAQESTEIWRHHTGKSSSWKGWMKQNYYSHMDGYNSGHCGRVTWSDRDTDDSASWRDLVPSVWFLVSIRSRPLHSGFHRHLPALDYPLTMPSKPGHFHISVLTSSSPVPFVDFSSQFVFCFLCSFHSLSSFSFSALLFFCLLTLFHLVPEEMQLSGQK